MDSALCDSGLLRARDDQFSRLKTLFDGGQNESVFFLQGINAKPTTDPYREPERWVDEGLRSLAEQSGRLKDEVVFRPLCLEFGPYGVHFVDRMFGARVYHHEGQWWSDCLKMPVGTLEPPDLERDETWRLARRVADAFLARKATVPLFGLPTIASALNIAVNLHGEEFLVALLQSPGAACHDLKVINELLCGLHGWYLERIPEAQRQPVVAAGRCQPPGFGQVCGCTTHLLSAQAYRELVAPLDNALLSVYPHGGMIHLCGRHTQHIPAWREMRSLRAVQLNDRAAEDLEIYFKGLRQDQIVYLNPFPKMTVPRAMEITGGRRIVMVTNATQPMPVRRPGLLDAGRPGGLVRRPSQNETG